MAARSLLVVKHLTCLKAVQLPEQVLPESSARVGAKLSRWKITALS
jgi:hypothetical protein